MTAPAWQQRRTVLQQPDDPVALRSVNAATAIRYELERLRAAGEPVPACPSPPDMFRACNGVPEDSLWATLLYLHLRSGEPAPRHRRRLADGQHAWTEHEDEMVMNVDLSPIAVAVELGLPVQLVKGRRCYLKTSRYAYRLTA